MEGSFYQLNDQEVEFVHREKSQYQISNRIGDKGNFVLPLTMELSDDSIMEFVNQISAVGENLEMNSLEFIESTSPEDSERLLQAIRDNPHAYIDEAFIEATNHWQSTVHSKWEDSFISRIFSIFKNASYNELNKIPSLNGLTMEQLPYFNGRLVRFRCMVQELYDPVMCQSYTEVYNQHTQTSRQACLLFSTNSHLKENEIELSPAIKLRDAKRLHCVTIPGESNWVGDLYALQNQKIGVNPTSVDLIPYRNWVANFPPHIGTEITSFPVPNTASNPFCKAVIGQVLHIKDDLLINEVVELYGILMSEYNPENLPILNHGTDTQAEDYDNSQYEYVRHPPSAVVPRLSVLGWTKRAKLDTTTLRAASPLEQFDQLSLSEDRNATLRKKLMDLLIDTFMGDRLTAQYVFLNMISKVHLRTTGDFGILGTMPLRITGVPAGHAEFVYSVLQNLLPKIAFVPNYLKSLMTDKWFPRKDYTLGKLMSGVLQLSSGTVLLLEELNLSHLDEQIMATSAKGSENLRALEEIIESQTLPFDFKYQRRSYDCDIPVLILSSCTKDSSVIQRATRVPFDPAELQRFESEIKPRILQVLGQEGLMSELRQFIIQSREFSGYDEIDEDASIFASETFCASRRQENEACKMDQMGFSRRFDICRYLLKYQGEPRVTKECWEKAHHLEIERMTRLTSSNFPSSSSPSAPLH